ncbi:MAG: hydratase [Ruminococcaceae bacterium]|nr:hydratase [Oscillospiraceae bacterium]
MAEIISSGVYLQNGRQILNESNIPACEAKKNTIAYGILSAHNTSDSENDLKIKFDALASHDITYVGIIQTARASGLKEFPVPYVLTNCHNSLCAVGGTINEDDHMFGLSAAKKYGGIYVPAHQAVIHSFMRETMSGCGKMILGSDSHTRYGALGTMAIGEGGPELVKQLLCKTYDVARPEVICVYLTGAPRPGVGPQDVALELIGAVFASGFVKNKVLEFVGDGIASLPIEYRNGIDVMTTETTCLSSIWETDEETERYFINHGRPEDYKKLAPGSIAYYDGMVKIDLSKVECNIALPSHPSNVYSINELNANADVILKEYGLLDKLGKDGKIHCDQGVIAGCAGGTYDNLCAAADILAGGSIGNGAFALSAYPASQPVYMELIRNGAAANLMASGVTLRTAFCGPCFGAGDVPANGGLSIRHSTRNFPNREGSKPGAGQSASVALMDARSIAATAACGGILTPASSLDVKYTPSAYKFDDTVYKNRLYKGFGSPKPEEELVFGPNIRDWPEFPALSDDLILKVASVILDPVTTTDELIPSGETSSYRSNPEALSEFALSRKDPAYVGRAKAVRALNASRKGEGLDELYSVLKSAGYAEPEKALIGSVVYAVKPGDGSAREQAASCQKVLGGMANIASEYATKRYRSNLINWGMLPFTFDCDENALPFGIDSYIWVPGIKDAVKNAEQSVKAYVLSDGALNEITLSLPALTDDERTIILSGCLINYYRG